MLSRSTLSFFLQVAHVVGGSTTTCTVQGRMAVGGEANSRAAIRSDKELSWARTVASRLCVFSAIAEEESLEELEAKDVEVDFVNEVRVRVVVLTVVPGITVGKELTIF